jgi:TrmH family RNA methyltransferase
VFVVEGLQPVWRAVASGWPVEMLVAAPDLLTNEGARRMVADRRAAGTPVVDVSREVFTHLSDRDGPAGLIAVVRGSLTGLDTFRPGRADRPVVALHRAGNPGNIGTILRTADAAGAAGLILAGSCADPLSPAAVKASMGSVFALPMAHTDAPDGVLSVLSWAAASGRPVVAVTGQAERRLWDTPMAQDAVLLMGSEGDGLSDEVAERCTEQVAIPMEGTAESLNLATATSLALYELMRRRHGNDRA